MPKGHKPNSISREWASFGRAGPNSKPRAEYYRCGWSSVVGCGVFRKRADQPNDYLIVTVVLPKKEAEALADKIVAILQEGE